MRRLTLISGLALVWMWVFAPAASADPPGPTNYLSEVVNVEPETREIDVEIVGGDSFVRLTAERGVSVEIVGYNGEPYLRLLPDGTVEENAASPSKYINQDRYGRVEVPEGVDAAAEPDWEVVATGGSYAWHDHRTHWMNPVAPPGRGPGDQVAEGVVPLLVNGTEVDVTVVSVWQEAPSRVPVLLGGSIGVVLGLMAIKRRRLTLLVTLAVAAGALFVGAVAYLSVPAATQPSWSLVVFPLVSMLLAAAARAIRSQRTVLLLVAGLELVVWGILHWDWLWQAVLPTELPFWLDRLIAAAVVAAGAGVVVAVLAEARHRPQQVGTVA